MSRGRGGGRGTSVLVLRTVTERSWSRPARRPLNLDLIDSTRAYFVTADGGAPADIAPAVDAGMVALSAELVGVAQRVEIANLRQGTRAVRPTDRFLPSGLAPARRHAVGGRGGARLPTTRRGAPRLRPSRCSQPRWRSSRLRCSLRGDPRRDPDPGWDRLHLGARHPLLPRAHGVRAADGTPPSTRRSRSWCSVGGPGARRGLNRLAPSPREPLDPSRRGSAPSRRVCHVRAKARPDSWSSSNALIRMLIWLGSSGLRLKSCAPFPQKHFSNRLGAARPRRCSPATSGTPAVDPGLCRSGSVASGSGCSAMAAPRWYRRTF